MRGKIILVGILLAIIYPLLLATFFFSFPFMASWGTSLPWYLRLISFLQNNPFSIQRESGEIEIKLLLVNAFFWTFILWLFFYLILLREQNRMRSK